MYTNLASQVTQWVKNPSIMPEMRRRDMSSIPGLGRSLGRGHGNPLQYSYLENPHEQRSLVSYSPWGRLEVDTTEMTERKASKDPLSPKCALISP